MKLFNSYSKNWVNRGTSILLFVSMSISPRNVSILSGDMPTRKISTLWNYVVWKGSTVLITYYSLQPVLNFSSKNLHFLTQVKIPWPSVKNNIFPLICDKPVELLFTSQSVRWFEFEAKTLEDVSFRNSISVSSFLWCNKQLGGKQKGPVELSSTLLPALEISGNSGDAKQIFRARYLTPRSDIWDFSFNCIKKLKGALQGMILSESIEELILI